MNVKSLELEIVALNEYIDMIEQDNKDFKKEIAKLRKKDIIHLIGWNQK